MIRRIVQLIVVMLFIGACSNSESEDVGVDCSGSDLKIRVVDFTKSDCGIPGSVTLEASGGDVESESDYRFTLDQTTFQDSPIFDNIFAGAYTFSVKDKLGCLANVSFVLESEPSGISLDITTEDSECGNNTGIVSVSALGGTGSLRYSLDGGAFITNNSFSNVGAGEHSITVKDIENCEITKFFQVFTRATLRGNVLPIIRKDCAISGCHNGSISPRLTTNEEVITNALRIKSETQSGSMPRDRTLSQEEIDFIACWVDDGARDN